MLEALSQQKCLDTIALASGYRFEKKRVALINVYVIKKANVALGSSPAF